MSATTDVSILVAFNSDRAGLARALASTRSLTGQLQLQTIVIDDGSEPRLTFGDSTQAPTVLRQQTVMGRSVAWNRGIAASTGRYVAFLDDHTNWHPAFLRTLIDGMRAGGHRWGHSSFVFGSRSALLPSVAYRRATRFDPEATSVTRVATAIVAERALLWEVGGFAPSYGALAGWELSMRLAQVAEGFRSDEPLVEISGRMEGRWPLRDVALERRALLERQTRRDGARPPAA